MGRTKDPTEQMVDLIVLKTTQMEMQKSLQCGRGFCCTDCVNRPSFDILPSLPQQSKLEECKEKLGLERAEIAKVQARESALTAAFHASVGENKFEDFLTKVFKKKIKRVHKTEQRGEEGERKCTA